MIVVGQVEVDGGELFRGDGEGGKEETADVAADCDCV